MKCKKCGAEFTEGIFCPECGEKYIEEVPRINPNTKKCPKCGAEFSEGVFCPECGTPYPNATQQTQSTVAPTPTPVPAAPAKKPAKKKSKLPLIIGGIIAALLLFIVLAVGMGGSGGSVSELSGYIPEGHDEVMKLISDTNLKDDGLNIYYNDDLRITLNDDGFIDTMTLKTDKYSLYGIHVGDEYSYNAFDKALSDHTYVMMNEDDNVAIWGITTGEEQDRMIMAELASGKISTIFFTRYGAYEQLELNQQAYAESSSTENNEQSAIAEAALTPDSFSMANLSGDEIKQMILNAKLSKDGYLLPTVDSEYLPESIFQYFSDEDLRLAINEVYARHGRQYQSEDLNKYFNLKSWYQGTVPAESFSESVFNAYEKSNIDMMAAIQTARKGGANLTTSSSSPAGTYAYQVTEIAGGQTEYYELPNFLVIENGDGSLSIESRADKFIIYPDGNGSWSGWTDDVYVSLSGNRLSLEYGDSADIYMKQQ